MAGRKKDRPSFGCFSTWERSMEAILGVLEAPKSVVGTWYTPFSANPLKSWLKMFKMRRLNARSLRARAWKGAVIKVCKTGRLVDW